MSHQPEQYRLRTRNVDKIDAIINHRPARRSTDPRQPSNYELWNTRLQQGLQRHRTNRNRRASVGRRYSAALQLHGPEELNDDEVINAIGTIWIALRRQRVAQSGIVFGYGLASLFKDCRTQEEQAMYGFVAAGIRPSSDTFIMPLLFSEDSREAHAKISRYGSSDIGHFLLAISSVDTAHPMMINTTVMDSCPRIISPRERQQAYQGLVQYSGWLELNAARQPVAVTPLFSNTNGKSLETFRKVPAQQGRNTCGLYVILNAWAHMLKIPIIESRIRGTRKWWLFQEFHDTAIEIINLALSGHMDSKTIRAFMNVYGYSKQSMVEEDNKDPVDQIRMVNAVRMNIYTLADNL